MSHRIRFRAGWTRHDGSRQTKVCLPEAVAIDEDGSGGTADDSAPVRYQRPFNCPSGLEEVHRVDLVIERWEGVLAARIDDSVLAHRVAAHAAPLRIEVTPLLRGHHQLWIDLAPDAGHPPRLSGIAYLEIHAGAVD